MSYAGVSAHGAFGNAGFGNGVGVSCIRLQTEMPGTGTYMPGKICPETPGKTGHQPPRPRVCGGSGVMDVQQGLKYAGIYKGPVDGLMNPTFTALVALIAQKYNVPWDGDGFTIGPNLCGAIIAEIASAAPPCSPNYDTKYEIGCVVKPSGALMQPIQPGAGGGSAVSPITFRLLPRKAVTPGGAAAAPAPTNGAASSTPLYAEPTPAAAPGGIPVWAYVAAGTLAIGGVTFFMLRKKRTL